MTFPNLYKYLDINGARLTLQNRTFKYAKPTDFNDTEDMTIRGLFPETIEQAALDIQHDFIDCLIKNINITPSCDSPTKEGMILLQENIKTYQRSNEIKQTLYNQEIVNITWFKDYCSRFIFLVNNILQKFRVLCVSELNDSIKMWERYAENHQGIALGITPDFQKDSCLKLLRKINYCPTRPTFFSSAINFLEKSIFGNWDEIIKITLNDIVYTKTLDYAYENEHRLAIRIFDDEDDWNTSAYHPNEITQLYIGAQTPKKIENEIIQLAKAINPKIEILNASIVNNRILFKNKF